MKIEIILEGLERVRYEVDRARRLLPTVIRFTLAHLGGHFEKIRETKSRKKRPRVKSK